MSSRRQPVKPDRHLERLAQLLGAPSPLALAKRIRRLSHYALPPHRLGTIDVTLWRWCVLTPDYPARLSP